MDKWAFLLARLEKSWGAAGKPRRILAAVSGGADSVALLYCLMLLRRKEEMDVYVTHVDHGLRQASQEDAAFVSDLCRAWNFPCQIERVQLSSGSEMNAREARYAALFQNAEKNGCAALALAHHRRDQAETVLLHLFRGSGTAGLCGMAERKNVPMKKGRDILLWRPFVDVPPQMLRDALEQQHFIWREDETNRQDDYLRNYLRHRVLPSVEKRIPEAEAAIARAAKVLQREDDYFQRQTMAFLERNACTEEPCRWIAADAFWALHPALQARVLRAVCPVELDFESTERILAAKPGDTVNLPGGRRLYLTGKYLHFVPDEKDAPPALFIRVLPYTGKPGDGIRLQAVPRSVWERCTLRFRENGDWIRPLGAKGKKSLQDYWVDKKLDRPFRPYMPLLCIGQQVIWSVGVGPGEEARVMPGDDAVLLQFEGYLPGENPFSNFEKE